MRPTRPSQAMSSIGALLLVVAITGACGRSAGEAAPASVVAATASVSASAPPAPEASMRAATPSPAPATAQAPKPTLAAARALDPSAIPTMPDVLQYKATSGRTGVQPGPGPVVKPVVLWSQSIHCPADVRTLVLGNGTLVATCNGRAVTAIDARTGAVRWTHDLPASSVANPVIADGVVYVGAVDTGLFALDLATGAELWSTAFAPAPMPVVARGLVYVGATGGRYLGLDVAAGEIVWTWTSPVADDVLAGTIVGDTVYLRGEGCWLYAVDLDNGKLRWKHHADAERFPMPTVTKDSVIVSGQTSGPLIVLDRATGKVRWTYASQRRSQIAPASVADGVVYAPSKGDGLYAFDLATGKVRWHQPTGDMTGQAVAISGDLVYVTTFLDIEAHDRATGALVWTSPVFTGRNFSSTLASGGLLFTYDDSGFVRAYAEPALAARMGG